MEVIRVMNAHWDNRSVSPHLAAETPTSVPDELKTPTTSVSPHMAASVSPHMAATQPSVSPLLAAQRVPPTTSVSPHLAAETPTSVPNELKTPTTSVSPHMAATQPSVSPLSAAQRVPPTTSVSPHLAAQTTSNPNPNPTGHHP